MALLSDMGICLGSKKIGESDLYSYIFTKKSGVETFTIKGIQKSKKRSGWIISGNILNIVYYKSSAMGNPFIKEADIFYSPLAMNLDFNAISLITKFLNTVRALIPRGEPQKNIYNLLEGFLLELAKINREKLKLLELFSTWRLLKYFGILDWPLFCSDCGVSLNKEAIYYSPQVFLSFVCSACVKKGTIRLVLGEREIAFFIKSLKERWLQLASCDLQAAELDNSLEVQGKMISSVLAG